jgi:DNA-binding IclR family transcriptional regulator
MSPELGRDKIQVLVKAMAILTSLAGGSKSVRELCELTGVTKPAAYRILHTMEIAGYVGRDVARREYFLGPVFIGFTKPDEKSMSVARLALPEMIGINKKFDETVNLGVLSGGRILYLECVESKQRLRTVNPLTTKDYVHSTALGKAILSTFSADEIEQIVQTLDMPRHTSKTLTNGRDLTAAIQRAKKRGFSLDDQENEMGSRCVASAILDSSGKAVAAMSVSGPVSRMTSDRIKEISDVLKSVCSKLSAEMVKSFP